MLPETKKQPAVAVRDLIVELDGVRVLDGLSFYVRAGDIVAVIGPNGSGKTTLLKAILGLLRPRSGEIEVFGKPTQKVLERIGYVPQRFQFDKDFPISIKEFLGFSLRAATSESTIVQVLKDVGLRALHAAQPLGSLSGGELQRVLIAHAICHNPDLLLLDEPSTGMDLGGEQNVLDIIRRLNRDRGTTIIMISHEIDVVARFVHEVICLNRSLVCHGTPKEALTTETLERLFGPEIGVYEHEAHHRKTL